MNQLHIEATLQNLDTRVTTVEQILPTLLTRAEFKTAMAKVPTKEDLKVVRDDLRNHFNAVAERLESRISLIAEGHGYLASRLDAFEHKLDGRFNGVDLRLDRTNARLSKLDMRVGKLDTGLSRVAADVKQLKRRRPPLLG